MVCFPSGKRVLRDDLIRDEDGGQTEQDERRDIGQIGTLVPIDVGPQSEVERQKRDRAIGWLQLVVRGRVVGGGSQVARVRERRLGCR